MKPKVESEKVVPAEVPRVIPRKVQPQAADHPLDDLWSNIDYVSIKKTLQQKHPRRRMKEESKWKYDHHGKILKNPVKKCFKNKIFNLKAFASDGGPR